MGGIIRPAHARDIDLLIWAKDTASEGVGRILRRADDVPIAVTDAAWRDETAAKIAAPDTSLRISNWFVAGNGQGQGAALLSYPMLAPPEVGETTPALLHPLFALMRRAIGTFYVDSVAVQPQARGAGLARALMIGAETRATTAGFDRLTLIALSSNDAARPLYFDLGYSDAEEVALVPSAWAPAAKSAFLMEKRLS